MFLPTKTVCVRGGGFSDADTYIPPHSNEANMQLVEQMGIFPDRYVREKRPALRSVIQAVIATIRMRNFRETWAISKEVRSQVARSVELKRLEMERRR